jgi:hypothetical protein
MDLKMDKVIESHGAVSGSWQWHGLSCGGFMMVASIKNAILSIYDSMQRAIDTGEPYKSVLDPPPADPRVTHHG